MAKSKQGGGNGAGRLGDQVRQMQLYLVAYLKELREALLAGGSGAPLQAAAGGMADMGVDDDIFGPDLGGQS